MKKAKKPLPKFIKNYMPKYYKDLKATKFSGNLTPRELLRVPGPLISMPVSFHPSFMKLRFVKDPDGETLIQDPILGFLKYKSDLFRKEFREPTYFLAREQIVSLRKVATELENKGEAHRAELLRNKAELLSRELLNIQGKTPRDKVVEGLSRGIAKTIYAATLAAPGSVLKNLGQIMFSWGVIGDYVFKGARQMLTPEGKALLKGVPHVYSDWRPEFIDIYKFAARERVGLNKINDVVKNAALYPDDLGSFEKELMEKIYGFREKSIGSIISRIQDIALIPFSWAEGWLRGTTYLGARQRFLDFHKAGKVDELWKEVRRPYLPEIKRTLGAGKVEEAASKYADDIVGIAQFRYGTLDTPNLLKTPGGRLLLQFTSFPLNTVNMIHYFMEHNMHENVAKLIGLGAYNLYVGAKLGINAKEFSLYGAIPYGAAPVPSMIFYLHHSYLYPDVVDNIYALNRLAYLSFPGGRFLRKVKYATESLLDYRNTGVLAIRDDTYKMSREISFPELVAYLFDLPTINQTKIRSDFKAVRRAKAEYLKLKRRAEIAYSRKDYEELERIKETTGFQLTDEQIANLEWAYNVEVFDRVLKRFPKQGRFLLGEKLEVSPDEMDEMLRRIELYKGGKM
ncbi:MAG: hypothetical protein DDT22_01259 [candidate division WS2 bacterium]|nr:hypothetical protein [Candidatus Lithacetigena glycinireducens]